MPGPIGNQNSVRHGLRMTLSQTPKGCRYIQQATAKLREALRAITLERRGELGLYEECTIQTACKWEVHSQLAARWLRIADGDLSNSDKLAFSRETARASGERDKCLERLGLNKQDRRDILDVIYGPQTPRVCEVEDKGARPHGDSEKTLSDATRNPEACSAEGSGDDAK